MLEQQQQAALTATNAGSTIEVQDIVSLGLHGSNLHPFLWTGMLSLIGVDRHQFDRARELVLSGDSDLNVVFGQQFTHPIRPFDDADTISL